MKHRPEHDKVAKVMAEFEAGTLRSPSGRKITDRKQAMAIAMAEGRKMGKPRSEAARRMKAKPGGDHA